MLDKNVDQNPADSEPTPPVDPPMTEILKKKPNIKPPQFKYIPPRGGKRHF